MHSWFEWYRCGFQSVPIGHINWAFTWTGFCNKKMTGRFSRTTKVTIITRWHINVVSIIINEVTIMSGSTVNVHSDQWQQNPNLATVVEVCFCRLGRLCHIQTGSKVKIKKKKLKQAVCCGRKPVDEFLWSKQDKLRMDCKKHFCQAAARGYFSLVHSIWYWEFICFHYRDDILSCSEYFVGFLFQTRNHKRYATVAKNSMTWLKM